MRSISKYKILFAQSTSALTNDVNALINEGWQPYGNIVSDHGWIYQPVVQYANPSDWYELDEEDEGTECIGRRNL